MRVFERPAKEQITALLAACGLPFEDLESRHIEHFLGCGARDSPSGVVGLEIYGSVALLRSLAVVERSRGTGCGRGLVAAAEQGAIQRGCRVDFSSTLIDRQNYHLFQPLLYQVATAGLSPGDIATTAARVTGVDADSLSSESATNAFLTTTWSVPQAPC